MLLDLFTLLSKTLDSSPAIALSGSLIWGILSIILSPCHLASIPLIIGFINGQGNITTKRAFLLSSLFSAGILVTIFIIGIITGLLGRMLGDTGIYGNYFVAIIFFIVGLHLLEFIRLPFLNQPGRINYQKKGLIASFLLGLIFGVALGPCTFAYMAPMLAVAFKTAATNFLYSVSLILMYAIGHCSVIIFAGTFTEYIQHYLNWSEKSKGAIILKKTCGILVIIAGIYLLY